MTTALPETGSTGKEIEHGDRVPFRPHPFRELVRRRAWVWSGRLWHVFTGGLRSNCCFMHLPKCGGTALTAAMWRTCPVHRQVGWLDVGASRRAVSLLAGEPTDEFRYHEDGPNAAAIFEFRRALLAYFLEKGAVLVTGHFLYDGPIFSRFRDRYKFVSTMRHPVERMISHYTEDLRNRYLVEPFDAYLETNVALRHATLHLRYFSGTAQIDPSDQAMALETAKQNLSTFDLIGFTEDMEKFSSRFSEQFGRRLRVPHLLPIRHYRDGVQAKPAIDASTRRRLEAMCAVDIELYEYARQRFG